MEGQEQSEQRCIFFCGDLVGAHFVGAPFGRLEQYVIKQLCEQRRTFDGAAA